MAEKFPARLLAIAALFIIIYYPVFIADYCYLDEIHQLWYNHDGGNYRMFTTQGRLLSGLLFDKLFASLSEINQIKYLRIFSFCGWVAVVMLWQYLFSKWVRLLQLDKRNEILTSVFITCCIPVSIYIGWSSCMEMFLGVAAGLLSGICFLRQYLKSTKRLLLFFCVLCCCGIDFFVYLAVQSGPRRLNCDRDCLRFLLVNSRGAGSPKHLHLLGPAGAPPH